MAADHAWVVVPSFEVRYRTDIVVKRLESEGCCIVGDFFSCSNFESNVSDGLLTIENTNDHTATDIECCLRVMVRSEVRYLYKVISSVEELRNIASVVMCQNKLAARVVSFITIQIKDEVIKNNKRPTIFDLDIKLLSCENLQIILRCFYVTQRPFISDSVDCLKADDK